MASSVAAVGLEGELAAPPVGRTVQLGAGLASFLAPLNSSMVAVALPDIRADFHVGITAITWLVTTYLIAVAVAQPVAGRLGDAFGHRRVVLWGLVLLALASVASAVAWTFTLLLLFRSIQGLAAALFMPNAMAYLRKVVPANQLGSALGTNGAAISAGAALGPVAGGLLLALADWRLLFLVNMPLAALAFWFVFRLEQDTGEGRAALRFDLLSLATLAVSFTGLALIGTSLRLGSAWLALAALAVLPAGLAAYWLRYRAKGSGVVDLRLFTRRDFAASAAGVALVNLVMYTVIIAMPVYLAELRDLSDTHVGFMLFGMSGAMVAISPLAGRWSDQFGVRPLVLIGTLAGLAAPIGLALLLDAPVALLLVPLALGGLAIGLTAAAQQTAAFRAWPASVAGSASGTFSMMRYVGSVTGAALIAAIIGAHPTESEFRALFLALTIFAISAIASALATQGRGETHIS